MHILKSAAAFFIIIFTLIGCASTNFATTSTPATITEEFVRQGAMTWRGTRILGFNNNYLKIPTMGSTYTIDPGRVSILISYRENKGGFEISPKFYDTYPIPLIADLKANKSYLLKATSNSNLVTFSIVDSISNETVATSKEVPIVYKSSDLPLESLIKK